MGIVYCATNLTNGKCYIGKTIGPLRKRQNEHFSRAGNSGYKFHNALKKYGQNNFIWSSLFESEFNDELCDKEMFWIKVYNTTENGYNMTFGGEGVIPTEEVREKISKSERGKIVSLETRQKISKAGIGRKPWNKGIPMLETIKIKISDVRKGIATNMRKVKCIDTGEIFESMKEAGRHFSLEYKNIQKCCSGNRDSCGGYKWQYVGGVK